MLIKSISSGAVLKYLQNNHSFASFNAGGVYIFFRVLFINSLLQIPLKLILSEKVYYYIFAAALINTYY